LAKAAAVTATRKETLVVVVPCSRYTAFFEQSIPFLEKYVLFYIHKNSVLEKNTLIRN
jgi:hypothetical protein